MNYITIGSDCSPAAALKNLNLRKYALPFDWVVTNTDGLSKCFEDNFSNFHTNLSFNHNKKRLIDEYGFEFPHDYPLMDNIHDTDDNTGEGLFAEEDGKHITDDWRNYYNTIKEKYNRRI